MDLSALQGLLDQAKKAEADHAALKADLDKAHATIKELKASVAKDSWGREELEAELRRTAEQRDRIAEKAATLTHDLAASSAENSALREMVDSSARPADEERLVLNRKVVDQLRVVVAELEPALAEIAALKQQAVMEPGSSGDLPPRIKRQLHDLVASSQAIAEFYANPNGRRIKVARVVGPRTGGIVRQ